MKNTADTNKYLQSVLDGLLGANVLVNRLDQTTTFRISGKLDYDDFSMQYVVYNNDATVRFFVSDVENTSDFYIKLKTEQ